MNIKRCMALLAILLSGITMGQSNSERAQALFNEVNRDTLHLVDEMYSEDAVFIDPTCNIKGRSRIRSYFEAVYRNTVAIRFDFDKSVDVADTSVLFWKMTFRNSKLKGGKPIIVHGSSHLKFDNVGRITYHRDYFDLGEMVYEHVFCVGWFVRRIRTKLAEH